MAKVKAVKRHRFEVGLDRKLFAHVTLRAAEARVTRVSYVRNLIVSDLKMWDGLKETEYPKEKSKNGK
jgi:hypothetical protein